MVKLGSMAIVMVSALLAGCGMKCPEPGYPGYRHAGPCSYSMRVVDIDQKRSEVTATISTRVKEERIDYAKPYTFRVRDLESLQLQKGKEYFFINVHNSPSLEAFPKGWDPVK